LTISHSFKPVANQDCSEFRQWHWKWYVL